MTDDLANQLRQRASKQLAATPVSLLEKGADRIEELDQACTKWAKVSQSNYQRAKAAETKLKWVLEERDTTFALMLKRAETAEAKLAKAVEGLQDLAEDFDKPSAGLTDFGERQHYLHLACRLRDKARTTLAAIKEAVMDNTRPTPGIHEALAYLDSLRAGDPAPQADVPEDDEELYNYVAVLEAKLAKTLAFLEFLDENYRHAFGDTARAKIRELHAELKVQDVDRKR